LGSRLHLLGFGVLDNTDVILNQIEVFQTEQLFCQLG
jgi:hypothetical protein